MEVFRLGAKSELQLLAHATATATGDPSCTIAQSNARSLIHWAGPGFESTSSCILVGFMTTEPQGNSRGPFYLQMDIQNLWERPSFPHRITSSPSFMKISAVCVTCIICWMCGSLSTYLYVWPYDGRTGSCFLQSIVKLWPPAFFLKIYPFP